MIAGRSGGSAPAAVPAPLVPRTSGPAGPQGEQGPPGTLDSAWFYAWQTGSLANRALFGGVDLEQQDYTPGDFYSDNTVVTVIRPGVYDVRYVIFVPSAVALNTVFALQQNNTNLPGMVVRVTHAAGTDSAAYTAQGIVRVTDPAAFRLSSSAIIGYEGTGTPAPTLGQPGVPPDRRERGNADRRIRTKPWLHPNRMQPGFCYNLL